MIFAKADTSKACQALADCLQTLQDGERKCNNDFPQNSTTSPPSKNPCKDTSKEAKLKEKIDQQHTQYIECLKSRQSESFDFTKSSREQEECDDVLSDYKTKGNRLRRDTSNSTSTPSNTVSTDSPKSNIVSTDSPNSDNGVDTDKSNSGEGKKKHHHHHHHGEDDDPKKECMKKLRSKKEQCRILNRCCTETKVCGLKFKLSKTYDEITQIQLDMALKEHDCLKNKMVSSGGSNSTSSN